MQTFRHLTFTTALLCILNTPIFAQAGSTVLDSVGGRPFYVYLPPGYDNTEQRYPVVYFFRGLETEWLNPSQDGSRRGDIRTVIDTLVSNHTIGHMIYVFPRMLGPTTLLSDRNYWVNELVPTIDQTYRTFPTRFHRAVDGFSNGGVMATYLTWDPHMMISVGAFDGVGGDDWAWHDSMLVHNTSFRSAWDALHFHYSSGDDSTQSNRRWVQEFVDYNYLRYGKTNSFDPIVITPGAVHNWYYADLHASITLPRHWNILSTPPSSISASITEPAPGSRQSGIVPVTYSVATSDTGIKVFLSSTRDEGRTWTFHVAGSGPGGTLLWDTTTEPDGALYQLRIEAIGDSVFGLALSPGRFTVDNPGNAPPDAIITDPANPLTLSGSSSVGWIAGDAEGDSISLRLAYSHDGGTTWNELGSNLSLRDSLAWQTTLLPNSRRYLLRLTAIAGTDTTVYTTRQFAVSNDRQQLSTAPAVAVGAVGNPQFELHVVDAGQLTGATYRVVFHTDGTGATRYSLTNTGTAQSVLSDIVLGASGEEGPLFDGLRLVVTYVPIAAFDAGSSGWKTGHSNLSITAVVPEIIFPTDTLRGSAYPADYALVMTDTISTTTVNELGTPIVGVPWYVWNITDNHQAAVEYVDIDMSGSLTHSDEILIFDTTGSSMQLTWDLVLSTPSGYTPPVAGDSFFIRIVKPIQDGDTFDISTAIVGVSVAEAVPSSPIVHEVYPNPFNPSTTISFVLPERSDVEISVHNLVGQQIMSMSEQALAPGEHRRIWRPLGLPSGIYFIRTKIRSTGSEESVRYFTRKATLLK